MRCKGTDCGHEIDTPQPKTLGCPECGKTTAFVPVKRDKGDENMIEHSDDSDIKPSADKEDSDVEIAGDDVDDETFEEGLFDAESFPEHTHADVEAELDEPREMDLESTESAVTERELATDLITFDEHNASRKESEDEFDLDELSYTELQKVGSRVEGGTGSGTKEAIKSSLADADNGAVVAAYEAVTSEASGSERQ